MPGDKPLSLVKKEFEALSYDDTSCRLCLRNKGDVGIFAKDTALCNKILDCFVLQMYENDGLPSQMCLNCLEQLNTSYTFKKQCEESDRILHGNISLEDLKPVILMDMPIKDEDDNLDDVKDNHSDISDDYVPLAKVSKRTRSKNVLKKIGKTVKRTKDIDKSDGEEKTIKHPRKRKKASALCPICGKVIVRVSSMRSHLLSHSGERPFNCEVCAKAFKDKAQLKIHSKIHTEGKNCPCEVCGKLFRYKHDVKRHNEIVHKKSKTVQCKLCGKKYSDKHCLETHMISHTGIKAFECSVCAAKFPTKTTLALHIRTHTGEKPYACRFCDSRFSIYKSRTDHERLHTGERPYACPVCGKGFIQLSNMKSHFRYNHQGIEFKYKTKKQLMREAVE